MLVTCRRMAGTFRRTLRPATTTMMSRMRTMTMTRTTTTMSTRARARAWSSRSWRTALRLLRCGRTNGERRKGKRKRSLHHSGHGQGSCSAGAWVLHATCASSWQAVSSYDRAHNWFVEERCTFTCASLKACPLLHHCHACGCVFDAHAQVEIPSNCRRNVPHLQGSVVCRRMPRRHQTMHCLCLPMP